LNTRKIIFSKVTYVKNKLCSLHVTSCHLGICSPDFIYSAVMKTLGSLHGPAGAINNFSSTLPFCTDFRNFLHMTAYCTMSRVCGFTNRSKALGMRVGPCMNLSIYVCIRIYVICVYMCPYIGIYAYMCSIFKAVCVRLRPY